MTAANIAEWLSAGGWGMIRAVKLPSAMGFLGDANQKTVEHGDVLQG